ncbi:MAG: hypothetical protein ACFBZ8_11360 [Opitutales bacterium]
MFKRTFLLAVSLLIVASLHAHTIRAVQHRAFSTADFERIAEYAGWEDFDGRLCVRSNSDAFDGHYFIVRFNKQLAQLPPDARIELEYLRADSPDIHRFETTLPRPEPRLNNKRLYLGLTKGGELPIPNEDTPLTAYRLRLFLPEAEKPVAVHESFLWRAPVSQSDTEAPTSAQSH